jgi:cell wall-associated NlpC family hydrolase
MNDLDKRLNAFRPDLADARLQGRVTADRFVAGLPGQMNDVVASIHKEPSESAMQISQALPGELLSVFEQKDGWSWVQMAADGYVGYIRSGAVLHGGTPSTHVVHVPSTHSYPEPSIKSQPAHWLPMLSEIRATGDDGNFLILANGRYVVKQHARPIDVHDEDPAAVAERFLHVPYYWGGKTQAGLDCSGLVQIALRACGIAAPRDSDMQEQTLGRALPERGSNHLRRNDLVFWKGHVGIMVDEQMLLHANGHHMMTVKEPLALARQRIVRMYGDITSIRRLQ